jgi:parvulin-like peptidyl-prolyl isomerase
MVTFCRFAAALTALTLCSLLAQAQTSAPAKAPETPAAPPPALITPKPNIPNTVAATVNGQPIPEVAVQRALKKVQAEQQAQVRPEIINFLVDKTLVDQFLAQTKIVVEDKDVDAHLKQVREEITKRGSTMEKVLHEALLTEGELKTEIAGQLRWEKYVKSQATDKALHELFDRNKEIFDGTVVRARHILVTAPANDPKVAEPTRAKLLAMKKKIEETVAQGMAKLPANTDKLAQERERAKLMDEAFAATASKESDCPSRTQGGDLGFFPRSGSMVEPFAEAAFGLKNHQVSDVVVTPFGMHLILVIDRKPGKQIKYEEVQEEVRLVFGDRLRESLVPQLRTKAKVVVNPPPQK